MNPKLKTVLWALIIGLLIAALSLWFLLYNKGNELKKETSNIEEINEIKQGVDELAIDDSSDVAANQNVGGCFIITGSFSTEENAQKQVQKLNEKGYDARIVERNSKFAVAAGEYAGVEEASEDLKKIRATFKPEAWILRK